MPLAARLRSRLVAIASVSTIAACGSSGGSDVGSTAPAGSPGTPGAGGSNSGSGGGSAGSAAGSGGAGGGSAAVSCPPADSGPVLSCWHGGGKFPAGCGTGMGGGDIACYVPGSGNTPPSSCLGTDDPALPSILSSPCESVASIKGTPACRLAAEATMPMSPVASCCYTATIMGLCDARPFYVDGALRTAKLARASEWSWA